MFLEPSLEEEEFPGASVHAVLISTTLPIIKVSREIFIHHPPSFIDGNIPYRLLNRSPKRRKNIRCEALNRGLPHRHARLASGWLASLAHSNILKNDTPTIWRGRG
jgi:hypothetical protein